MNVERFVGFAGRRVRWFAAFAGLAAFAVLLLAATGAAQRGEFESDMKRLVPAVDLRAGQTVADIGAGGGELTVALAKEVGPAGRVYATEIDENRLERLRKRAAAEPHGNITVLEAHATRTNLPAACCDVIVIRNVYHHFGDPTAMNRSVFESLKPGGRLAIIDFEPRRGGTAAPRERDEDSSHGVDPETVAKELAAAGLDRVSVDTSQERSFMAVFRRP